METRVGHADIFSKRMCMQIVGACHYEPKSKLQLELVWLWIWIKIGLFGHRYINISHISYVVDDLHGQMAWNHLFRIRMANSYGDDWEMSSEILEEEYEVWYTFAGM